MNKIISACLILLLASLVTSTPTVSELENLKMCLNKESLEQLTGLVYDLYSNKLSFSTFVTKFLEANADYSESFKCVKTYGGDAWKLIFSENSLLTKVGFTLLYESNCAKDAGVVLLLADKVLADIKDISRQWKDLVGAGIMAGLAGMQGYSDCKDAFEQIRDVWSH
jgi:hypothetical protein